MNNITLAVCLIPAFCKRQYFTAKKIHKADLIPVKNGNPDSPSQSQPAVPLQSHEPSPSERSEPLSQ